MGLLLGGERGEGQPGRQLPHPWFKGSLPLVLPATCPALPFLLPGPSLSLPSSPSLLSGYLGQVVPGPETEEAVEEGCDLRGGLWFAAWWGWGFSQQGLSTCVEGLAPSHSNLSGPC